MMDEHIKKSDRNLINLQSKLQSEKSIADFEFRNATCGEGYEHTFWGIVCEIPGLSEKMKRNQFIKQNNST